MESRSCAASSTSPAARVAHAHRPSAPSSACYVDGYDAHSGRVAFERDRLKVAKLTAAGLRVMQVTGRQVRGDPGGVTVRLRAALSG